MSTIITLLLVIALVIAVGGVGIMALAAYNDRKAEAEGYELAKLKYQADTKLTELQVQILAKHYDPAMEIIFAQALMLGSQPIYLDMLEEFRAVYPRAYALWTRHRGFDSTLDTHVRSNQTLGFID